MPSPMPVNRSLLEGSMGRTCLQSPSFSRALLIQFTKATFSSSAGGRQHTSDHSRHLSDLLQFSPSFCSLSLTGQLKSVTGNRVREGEWHAAEGPGPRVQPGSAAEPRHMGRTLPTELSGARSELLLIHSDVLFPEPQRESNPQNSIWLLQFSSSSQHVQSPHKQTHRY